MSNKKPKRKNGARRKKGSRKKGLGSTATKAATLKEAVKETAITGGGNVTGLLTSALVGYGIDQIKLIAPKETDGKIAKALKKAIKPFVITTLGGTISVVSRKKGIKFGAAFGDGMLAGGVFTGVKSLAGDKVKIFNGLGSADVNDDSMGKVNALYQENMQALQDVMAENQKMINLNGGGADTFIEGLNEKVTIPGTQLEIERLAMIM